jgi:hypothetical protein
MKEQFVIKHQDGDIIREVKSARIRFTLEDGTWKVGLELKTFRDYDPDDEGEGWEGDDDPIILHLMDFPVGPQDPRAKGHFEIAVPKGFDAEEGRYWANLYFGEHFQPDNSRIRVTRLPDDAYLVEWACTGEDVDYYDKRAKDNKIIVTARARVVDRIPYPW